MTTCLPVPLDYPRFTLVIGVAHDNGPVNRAAITLARRPPPLPFGTTWSAVGFAVRTTAASLTALHIAKVHLVAQVIA